MASLLTRAKRLVGQRRHVRSIVQKLDVRAVNSFGSSKRFYSGTGADQDDDSFIFPEYESEPSERSFWEIYDFTDKSCNLFQRLLTTMLLRSIQQGSILSHQFRDSQFNSGAEFVMYNWSINNFINDSADAVQTFLESIHPYKDPNNAATQDALAAMTLSDLYVEGTSKDEQHLVTTPPYDQSPIATPLKMIQGLTLITFDHFNMLRYIEGLLTWDKLSERMSTDFDEDLNWKDLADKRDYEGITYGQDAYWELIGTKGIVDVEYFPSSYQVYQRALPTPSTTPHAEFLEMLKEEAIKGIKNQETYVAISVKYNLSLVHPDNDEESTNHDVKVLWFGALRGKKEFGQWKIARIDFYNLISQTHHIEHPFEMLYRKLLESRR